MKRLFVILLTIVFLLSIAPVTASTGPLSCVKLPGGTLTWLQVVPWPEGPVWWNIPGSLVGEQVMSLDGRNIWRGGADPWENSMGTVRPWVFRYVWLLYGNTFDAARYVWIADNPVDGNEYYVTAYDHDARAGGTQHPCAAFAAPKAVIDAIIAKHG